MPFTFEPCGLPGLLVIRPRVFADGRGFFMETFKASDFEAAGIEGPFVQDNQSLSARHVLRGLHYQLPPRVQGKLVRVLDGNVWDVAVDLRRSSSTFGKWFGIELSAENKAMLWVPPGFAHGFLTLSSRAHVLYKCTDEYSRDHEAGIRWDDQSLAIQWPARRVIVSDKDRSLPPLSEVNLPLAEARQ